MKKKFAVVVVALGLSVFSAIPAFAAGWQNDNTGWWYQNDDGTYPASAWKWIDGNNDGIAECYYFDQTGYVLTNTVTPDNCTVNNDGAWTVDGVVQTKQADASNGAVHEIDLQKAKGKYKMVEASQNGVERELFTTTAELLLCKDNRAIAWSYSGYGHEIMPCIDTNKWHFYDGGGGILTLIDEETVDILTDDQVHYVFKKIK